MRSNVVRTIIFAVVILLFVVIIGVYETLRQHQAAEQQLLVHSTVTITQSQTSLDRSRNNQPNNNAILDMKSSSYGNLVENDHNKSGDLPIEKVDSSIHQPKRKRIAYAITITKDGFFGDGAAVLVYSILKSSVHSAYDISFVAFVHPNVTLARAGLTKIGFHVIEVPIPINSSAIKFDFLREKINKNGCCGSSEMIKLSSYRLEQYHRVIHLDADVLMLNPIDDILDKDYSLIYTTDPNMATFKGDDKMPAQGGFLVFKPSVDDYRNIIRTEMTTEFKKYHGWNSSHIGWFWGGMTVQGILPYYYQKVSSPSRILLVDRCYYNTMADTDECSVQTLDQLKSAHFTVCQKPWNCYKAFVNRLCGDLHRRWLELREEAEQFYGIHSGEGSCRGIGQKNYIPMKFDNAKMPLSGPFAELVKHVVPDDSADRIEPLSESMYISNKYD